MTSPLAIAREVLAEIDAGRPDPRVVVLAKAVIAMARVVEAAERLADSTRSAAFAKRRPVLDRVADLAMEVAEWRKAKEGA